MEQTFTEAKRLAILEIAPTAHELEQHGSRFSIYDNNGMYAKPFAGSLEGNPYNLNNAKVINLTKPIKTQEEKLRQYCIKFANSDELYDLMGVLTSDAFWAEALFIKWLGTKWVQSQANVAGRPQITYQEACKIIGREPIKELTKAELVRDYVVELADHRQAEHWAKEIDDWETVSEFRNYPIYSHINNSNELCISSNNLRPEKKKISYEKGCEIAGIKPIKPTIEDMKDYAIECGSVAKCDAVKDFVRANGGDAYENGDMYNYITKSEIYDFQGSMGVEGKTIITFPDAQKKWGIPAPKVQTRRMKAGDLFGKYVDLYESGMAKLVVDVKDEAFGGFLWVVNGTKIDKIDLSKIKQYKDSPLDAEWKSTEVEV